MKTLLYICCIGAWVGGAAPAAYAQGRPAADAPSAAQQLVEEIGLDRLPSNVVVPSLRNARNLSALQQTGNGNQATITQVSTGNDFNQALIMQVGAANAADLSQYGAGNAASLRLTGDQNKGRLEQDGGSNAADMRLTGNNNNLDVLQNGQGNSATLDAVGSNRRYGVSQIGDNNVLTQQEGLNSSLPKGYNVEMRGNGIRMTIEQGNVLHP